MASIQPPPDRCKWCGEALPPRADRCPLCRRPASAGPDPALDDGPPAPAAGQEPFGSWANIKQTIAADKAFGAVVILLALQVALSLLTGSLYGLVTSGIVLWGLLTFRWWGLLLACVGAGLALLSAIGPFLIALSKGGGYIVGYGLPIAINAYILVVLLTRREHFD